MKAFLNNNKIYFETIAAIAISLMALIVSYQANSIAENAVTISKIEHLPKVSAYFRYDGNTEGVRAESLIISNSGDDMYDFHAYPFAFLRLNELKLITPDTKGKTLPLKTVSVPVTNYFPILSYISNVNKGVFSEQTISNTQKLDGVISDFESDHRTSDKSMGGSIERYLMVSYVDKFDKKHKAFFKFDPFGTSVPMDEASGEVLLSMYEQVIKQHDKYIDYDNATKADVAKAYSLNQTAY